MHPEFASGAVDVSTTSAAYFLSYGHPVTDAAALVVEVPFAWGRSTGFGASSGGVLGNIMIAGRLDLAGGRRLEAGGRLPTTPENGEAAAYRVGFESSLESEEAFLGRAASVFAVGDLPLTATPLFSLRARLGASAATGVGSGGGSLAWALYGLQAWVTPERVRAGVGVTGRMILNTGYGSLDERSLHELGAHVDIALGPVRPGLDVRIPLGRAGYSRDYSVGLGLQYTLP